MFVAISRNNKPLASISLLSQDKRRAAELLAHFVAAGGCTFILKRRIVGGRCVEEELCGDEMRDQIRRLYKEAHRPIYTPVHLGPTANALRSSFAKRIGARC